MTDKVYDEIMAIRATGKVNMLSIQEVFELALQMDFDSLADYIFEDTHGYSTFILTGQRE
jgi:hypothetical protein